MNPLQYYYTFIGDLVEGRHNLRTHTLQLALTDRAPDRARDRTLAHLAELAAGSGYTAGGRVLTQVKPDLSRGQYTLFLVPPDPWIAVSQPMGPFRYLVLYNQTADRLIGWYDYGESVTLKPGEPFSFDPDPDGVLTLGESA